MHCIECDKDCPMKYERNADIQTPCYVCIRKPIMPTPECWECARGNCKFEEYRNGDNTQLQRLF